MRRGKRKCGRQAVEWILTIQRTTQRCRGFSHLATFSHEVSHTSTSVGLTILGCRLLLVGCKCILNNELQEIGGEIWFGGERSKGKSGHEVWRGG